MTIGNTLLLNYKNNIGKSLDCITHFFPYRIGPILTPYISAAFMSHVRAIKFFEQLWNQVKRELLIQC